MTPVAVRPALHPAIRSLEKKDAHPMSNAPRIETAEIADTDLDNIAGGLAVHASVDGLPAADASAITGAVNTLTGVANTALAAAPGLALNGSANGANAHIG